MRPALIALAALSSIHALPARADQDSHAARATLRDAKGQKVGAATFTRTKDGVTVALQVTGLPPGTHAFHVHAVGKCDAPDFKSAGPHFNPGERKHGMKNPQGHHAGDLPNVVVGADGTGQVSATLADVSLGEGPASLFHPGGTAVVVHADPDDEVTDPAGNAGARVACGVVTPGGGDR